MCSSLEKLKKLKILYIQRIYVDSFIAAFSFNDNAKKGRKQFHNLYRIILNRHRHNKNTMLLDPYLYLQERAPQVESPVLKSMVSCPANIL